jgi:hypothetical protein
MNARSPDPETLGDHGRPEALLTKPLVNVRCRTCGSLKRALTDEDKTTVGTVIDGLRSVAPTAASNASRS